MDAISLSFHKEMAKEKEPKGRMPFGFPQCAVAGEINLAARRKSRQLQILRLQVKKTCKHGSRSDSALTNDVSFCLVPCDRRKLKQDGKAKAFASANPSAGWDICPADGGGLRSFAFPPFFVRTADGAVSKGGSLWRAFLVRSLPRGKE